MFPIDTQVIAFGGYGAVAIGVAIESFGVPFPGETILVAAALYAGASHGMSIVFVVLAATAGAVCGGSFGFWAGRQFGLRLLSRFGGFVGITPKRIGLGRYLFLLHGGKLVFFGRFLTLVRTIVAFLAGAGQMTWSRFSVCNSAGAITWAAAYGGGAYYLGRHIELVMGPTAIVGWFIAFVLMAGMVVAIRKQETRLIERAAVGMLEADNPETGS